jgi:hypothetical protein
MSDRSARIEVRNPLLALPAMAALRALPPDARVAICALVADLRIDAARRAEESWRKNKGPMAAYWKAVSVYALHIGRALR